DPRFLTGRGRFIEDIDFPAQAWMQVVRSPHAHAAIERIDIAAARTMPGVLGVFTATDLADLGPLPCTVPVATVAPMIAPSRFARSEEQRLNSSHRTISYAVFCLKKKKTRCSITQPTIVAEPLSSDAARSW